MSAAYIGAAGAALDRESESMRTAWAAMSTEATGDVLDRIHHDVVLPYINILKVTGDEIGDLTVRARRVESLLSA